MTSLAADLTPWVALVALIIGIANTLSQWLGRPGRELKERVDELGDNTDAAIEVLEKMSNDRFKEHDRRIQAVESELKHTPTGKDLNDLQQAVTKLETQMPILAETMQGLTSSIRTIDRHLLESKK